MKITDYFHAVKTARELQTRLWNTEERLELYRTKLRIECDDHDSTKLKLEGMKRQCEQLRQQVANLSTTEVAALKKKYQGLIKHSKQITSAKLTALELIRCRALKLRSDHSKEAIDAFNEADRSYQTLLIKLKQDKNEHDRERQETN